MKLHTTIALAAILMLALVGSAAAYTCSPSCAPGEECQITSPAHLGPCHNCHGFECFSHPCGWFKHRHMIPAEYGCIAVSCPAIPCNEGYECTAGVCTMIPPTDTLIPYEAFPPCGNPLTADVTVNVSRHDIPYVTLSCKYDSRLDTCEMCTYHGEWLSDGFYNPVVDGARTYGGMPAVSLVNPRISILVRAAKDSLTDQTLPMSITLRDDMGAILYEETTTSRTIETTVILTS